MRPPQKAGGNGGLRHVGRRRRGFNEAPAKSGGEYPAAQGQEPDDPASMRPPQKAGGNSTASAPTRRWPGRFNEAPAKSGGECPGRPLWSAEPTASMRPPQKAGGNGTVRSIGSMRPAGNDREWSSWIRPLGRGHLHLFIQCSLQVTDCKRTIGPRAVRGPWATIGALESPAAIRR